MRGQPPPEPLGVERPLQVLHGPLLLDETKKPPGGWSHEDLESELWVTLRAGPIYKVDEVGCVRDGQGNLLCKIGIWRILPRTYAQAEAERALTLIEKLLDHLDHSPEDESLRAEAEAVETQLRAVIGQPQ